MKLLARLMSHGFAVFLVALLALGFIYRGELFPEWELPDFLVLESATTTTKPASAGKAEPAVAPVVDDWMASTTTTASEETSAVIDDAGDAGHVSESIPAVDDMVAEADRVAGTPVHETASVESTGEDMTAAQAVEETAEATVAASDPGSTLEVAEVANAVTATAVTSTDTGVDVGVASPDAVVVEVSATEDTRVEPASITSETTVPRAVEPDAPQLDAVPATAVEIPAGIASETAIPQVADSNILEPDAAPAIGEEIPASGMPVEDEAMVSSYQLLASAREAYWMRDFQTAEEYYRRMIMNDPYNPDGYGELANMYFSQGNWEAASSAYYEAGLRLVKSGLLVPASELVGVIRGLNGSQADALESNIQKAREASE